MNKRDLARKLRYWLLWVWLCFESGGFAAAHLGWDHFSLFWPFWISMFIAITLGIELVDRL